MNRINGLIDQLASDSKFRPGAQMSLSGFLTRWGLWSLLTSVTTFILLPAKLNLAYSLSHFSYWAENLLWLGLIIEGARLAYLSSIPGLNLKKEGLLTLGILTGLLVFTFLRPQPDTVYSELVGEIDLWRGRCGFIILAFSAFHTGFSFYWLRKMAPTSPLLSGALIALSSGALSCLLMQYVCGHENTFHQIIWHMIPVAIVCTLSALISRQLLRW